MTVALAMHLPAIGWVETRIRVGALRWVALAIAIAVLVRLILNPFVLDYPLGATPILNWLLYGYGVPAAAFIVATRQFGASRDDALVWVLEAGSIVFSLLLLTLELIHAIYGRLTMGWLDDFGSRRGPVRAVVGLRGGGDRARRVPGAAGAALGRSAAACRRDGVLDVVATGRAAVRRSGRRSAGLECAYWSPRPFRP